MSGNDSPSNNPFVRFKNNVDDTVKRGIDVFVGPQNPGTMTESPKNGTPASKQPKGTPEFYEEHVTAEQVYNWADTSPYSPYNLQNLPQPVPRDAPKKMQNAFTFQDAFEDLLLVRSGQSLGDIQRTALLNIFSATMYDEGLPLGDWVGRLGQSGLWGAYFPLSSWDRRVLSAPIPNAFPREKVFHPRHGILDRPQAPESPFVWPSPAEPHHQWSWPTWTRRPGLEEQAANTARKDPERSDDADTEEDLYRGSKIVDELTERLGHLRRSFFGDSELDPLKKNDGADAKDVNKAGGDPDLLEFVKSTADLVFKSVSGILDEFTNLNNDHNKTADPAESWTQTAVTSTSTNPPSSVPANANTKAIATTATTTTTRDPGENVTTTVNYTDDGHKIVTTTRRHTRGNRDCETVTREHYDPAGHLVSRETSSSSSNSWSWSSGSPTNPGLSASTGFSWQKKKSSGVRREDRGEEAENDDDDDDDYDVEEWDRDGGERRRERERRGGWFWTK
ncbi:hypothetical protein F4809DRAFT_640320 [Biscogniauxia mediterranea]|nr:hypothetical protein F4809DRAFT_640320 [Biscogniauxia mediterranea]